MKLNLPNISKLIALPVKRVIDLLTAGITAHRSQPTKKQQGLIGTRELTRFLQEEGFYDCAGQNDLIEE